MTTSFLSYANYNCMYISSLQNAYDAYIYLLLHISTASLLRRSNNNNNNCITTDRAHSQNGNSVSKTKGEFLYGK